MKTKSLAVVAAIVLVAVAIAQQSDVLIKIQRQQRAAIARALANDPPLLLADEPTGSLDSHAGQHVIELLHTAAREHGKAVLVVSHDVRVRSLADRVLEMEDGLLRESQ